MNGARGVFCAEHRAQRNAASQGFCQGGDVGQHAVVLIGAPLSSAAHAGLNLICDKQRAGGASKIASGLQEFVGHGANAAFALDRFDEDGAEFGGEFRLQVVDIVEADKLDSRHHGIERLAVLVFPGRGGGAHGAAVKAVFEGEELRAELHAFAAFQFCVSAGQLERSFVRFGSGVREEGAIHSGGFGEA